MKIGIVGLSNSGKTTIFNALTGQDNETSIYPSSPKEYNIGIVKVRDERIDNLSKIYMPKKTVYATTEYIDYLGLTKGDTAQNKKVFDLIKDVDAIVNIVRNFKNNSVLHPMNAVNPIRDIETVELEFIVRDLEFIENRLFRIDEAYKKGKKQNEIERALLIKCKDAIEKETPIRNLSFTENEQKIIKAFQFISIKPEIIVLNIDEEDLNNKKILEIQRSIGTMGFYSESQCKIASICGKIEMELAQMTPLESKMFLQDLAIQEPAMNNLINIGYELLGLISFLTVGEDEVRAWTITKGTQAQSGAGKIHSDIERGFIRAEVINYNDFMSCGNMSVAKNKGLLRLEGKTYEIKDGDIINFRFNV